MKIIDISHDIAESTKGFPSEPLTTFRLACDISDDTPVRVSAISLSSHAATHVDAPSHYDKEGLTIEQLALNPFVGSCVVIDLMHVTDCIVAEDLARFCLQARVLCKVKSERLDFISISSDCIAYLAEKGVILLGTTAISIDKVNSKTLPAHHACYQHGIQIVEYLNLDAVNPGVYTFIGLPLKLVGLDASPVRAVLIDSI
jgi:arylformamidase